MGEKRVFNLVGSFLVSTLLPPIAEQSSVEGSRPRNHEDVSLACNRAAPTEDQLGEGGMIQGVFRFLLVEEESS